MLKLDHISKSYHTRHRQKSVLTDISFEVQKGERLVIMGESGCGKTTLLNIIAGLIPPDSGSLSCCDELKHTIDLSNEQKRANYRFDYIGIIPQGVCLINQYTVMNNICFVLHQHNILAESAVNRALDALQQLQIEDIADEPVHLLSMGQKQRVAIARSLALAPSIILADEPTSALDPVSSQLVLEALNRSVSTILMVSHDHSVTSICQHVYELKKASQQTHFIRK